MRNLIAVLVMVALSAGVRAQPADKGPLVSVTGQNMDVTTALSVLARQSDTTIMAAPEVTGTVDLALANLPLEDALDAVSRAAYLRWRKVLAPPGITRTELQRMVTDADSVDTASIVVAPTGSRPATAVLSGAAAEKLWGSASDLGLREVYWVYSPSAPTTSVVVKPLESTTAASSTQTSASGTETSAATSADSTDNQPVTTPSQAYDKVSSMLSQLSPEEAMGVLRQAQQDLVATYAPLVEPEFIPPVVTGSSPAYIRPGNAAVWGPPRLRTMQPNAPVIFRPSLPPYYWAY